MPNEIARQRNTNLKELTGILKDKKLISWKQKIERLREGGSEEKYTKRYKPSVTSRIYSEYLMYRMVAIADDKVLHG